MDSNSSFVSPRDFAVTGFLRGFLGGGAASSPASVGTKALVVSARPRFVLVLMVEVLL